MKFLTFIWLATFCLALGLAQEIPEDYSSTNWLQNEGNNN